MVQQSSIAASPNDIGVDPTRLEELFAFVQREIDEDRLPSAQVAVGREGRLAGMRSFGRAVQGGVLQPSTDSTLYCAYSSTKAILGAAVWGLIEDGLLRLEERVADIVPEFRGAGKDEITAEQVLLLVAGFPYAPMHPRLWEDRQARLERIKGWRLNWEPGSRFEYHPTSAHWVLAEIITSRTGLDFRDYVRQRIVDPMGLRDMLLGLPDDQQGRAADVLYTEDPIPSPAAGGEINPETVLHFNYPSQRRAGCPGGGAFTTAADLALFYQVLLNGGVSPDSGQVLRPETIEMATTVRSDPERHRDTLNDIPACRGLSVAVAGNDGNAHLRGFGRGTSGRAFGHGGVGGQIGWGDPESGLSLGFVTNGVAGNERIRQRTLEVSTLAAACAI